MRIKNPILLKSQTIAEEIYKISVGKLFEIQMHGEITMSLKSVVIWHVRPKKGLRYAILLRYVGSLTGKW